MKVPIVIPQLGVVDEVTVTEWLKSSGDSVSRGDPIVVIETGKAETELDAEADGVLEVVVAAGPDPVDPGTVLGYIVS